MITFLPNSTGFGRECIILSFSNYRLQSTLSRANLALTRCHVCAYNYIMSNQDQEYISIKISIYNINRDIIISRIAKHNINIMWKIVSPAHLSKDLIIVETITKIKVCHSNFYKYYESKAKQWKDFIANLNEVFKWKAK